MMNRAIKTNALWNRNSFLAFDIWLTSCYC